MKLPHPRATKIGAITLVSCAAMTVSSWGLSIGEAVNKALSRDPAIKQAVASIYRAEGYSREVKADFMPQVNIEGQAGWAKRDRSIDGVATGGDDLFSRRIGVRVRQLLFDFGYQKNRLRDARKREEAQAYLEKAVRDAIALETAAAYLDVVAARKELALAHRNLSLHKEIGELAKGRTNSVGDDSDVELSAARIELAETLVLERELSLAQAEAAFARFTGMEAPANMSMPRIPNITSKSQIDPRANWRYSAVTTQYAAAIHRKKAKQRNNYPKFFLEGGAFVGEDVLGIEGRDDEYNALLVMNWSVWDSGRNKGVVQQAQGDIDEQAALIEETLVKLEQDIRSTWEDLATHRQRINVLNVYSDKLSRTGDLYQNQFDNGKRPLLSLLDIRNEKISADTRIVDEEKQARMLAYELLALGGKLSTYFDPAQGGKGGVGK
ncbi:TolC family protein [Sulfuriroseicoccus oceanibius]|uniref:TolC family protein n=1 Tax=Sulfuriroseicoccus oceanibius TaxID=2707525 RepID=A0A6B3L2V5_9BACT|nr:TolC family protein [Sulfuriroseicoccus oceanibius]QQL44539.1 TolC family protein [Sulfuriroseicoccus oceanibius]